MEPLDDLIGESSGISAVRAQIGRLLGRQPDKRRFPPVLIQGETGTGKGLAARLIHQGGPRASGPFVEVNCAAIPETLLEAELFGFERGAFTDARQPKPGLFQAANGGTLFLDEIGLLPEGLQAKLLNVIEERMVRRLGSTRSEPVDAWILAATNEDLAAATRERRFREDLYHRLAVFTLRLPPLRERAQDIERLAEHFLARTCAEYGLPAKTLASEALEALRAYPWPGNVRELSNVIERVALLAEGPLVTAEMLGLPARPSVEPVAAVSSREAASLEEAVGSVERAHVVEALRETGGNITRAAARLGVSRNTLRYRMEKHGLKPGAVPPRISRRTERAAPAPAAVVPPDRAAEPTTVRWEPRRLTLLRAALAAPQELDSPLYAARGIEVLVEKVQSFGGRVEELGPTGIVAAFGLEPVEDAPRRAAHAAMAIRKAAERQPTGEAGHLATRMGIHVGQFLVGRTGGVAQIDPHAKQEAGGLLAQLVGIAEPDTILVSEAAASFLERRFALTPLRPTAGGPGRVYRLAGRERSGLGVGRRMVTFVGRRQELDLLESRLASALRGHGQVVGIVGEAGIGKSRLLFEFRRRIDTEAVVYLRGRCPSYGMATPYLPVLDILRRNFLITDGDSSDDLARKVRVGLEAIGMDPEADGPFILHLLGVQGATDRVAVLSSEAVKARTIEALRQMALSGSRRRPIVFEVEDLHWVDRASEEYVTSLVEGLHSTPILFVTTYRPGYRPPWMDKSYATQIALPPLSPEESLSVIRSALEPAPLPEALAQMILDKAEGNPFFLEELSRAVEEQGGPLAVPDTVQEVLLARIDRLPDETKRVLQTAAVLGREVPLALLGAIWEGPGDLSNPLGELTRLEFLYQRSPAEEPLYVFKHSLTQEVAYASLAAPRRHALHAEAGRALEALYADRLDHVYGPLAHHYANTENASKAVEYLTRFAERAARSYAHDEAVRALQAALSHAERLPAEERDRRILDLALRQASSLFPLGRFQAIAELLRRRQERLERLDDARLAGHYHFVLGHTYIFLGEHERAVRSARRAIEEAERCGDEATMGKAYCLLALEAPLAGQARQGLEHGRQAVVLLERTGEQWWLGQAHWLVGLNHAQVGDFEAALEAEVRARSIAETTADPRLDASAAWVMGIIYAAMGEGEEGVTACWRALERAPDPLNRAIAAGWLGFAYLEKGDPVRAIPLLERAVQDLGQFGFRQFHGWFMVFLAEACRLTGQQERALEAALQALDISRAAKFPAGVGWAQQALGRLARDRGALEEATTHLEEALRTLAEAGARYEMGRVRLDLTALAQARGNLAAAAEQLRQAHECFQTLRLRHYVDRVEQAAGAMGVRLGAP